MRFVLLAERPNAFSTVATWYFEEWGRKWEGETFKSTKSRLLPYLNVDAIPLVVLALDGEQPVGAAQLKFHELPVFPQREHWLGGVYVVPSHRGRGVGRLLVEDAVSRARALGVTSLHLQTEQLDGGLYARLGWEPREKLTYNSIHVLVMERRL